ncbi:hypothetical protein OPIT5_00390 (plasmid) [Opitutaceae bacterium TAV5]|nr:hypothetical protein OPIT5_00390 [Opitutaceae bacterium TAV5]
MLVGDSVKGQAELLLRITAQRNFRDLVQLAKHAAELWPRVEPYVRYAAFLKSPGTHFRIRDQTLTFEEGGPLLDQLSELQATLSRRGYSARKAESFIRNAGNRLSRLREFPSPAPHRQTVP